MQRDLVLSARGGDRDAFEVLVADGFERLHRTARLILRSDDLAADAVQNALISAWLHIHAIRDPDQFDAWLHRRVVNACYTEARRQRRHRVREVQVEPFETQGSADAQGSTAAEAYGPGEGPQYGGAVLSSAGENAQRRYELGVVDVASGVVKTLYRPDGFDTVDPIEFSADGKRLLFRRS